MSTSSFRLAMACCAAGFTMVMSNFAQAQASSRSDPSDAKAEVPAVIHESPFKGYRKFEDQSVASWQGANDLVKKLGGWKAFASGQVPDVTEDRVSGTAPSQPPRSPVPEASGGHAGHKTN
jgi:hypothetical protein